MGFSEHYVVLPDICNKEELLLLDLGPRGHSPDCQASALVTAMPGYPLGIWAQFGISLKCVCSKDPSVIHLGISNARIGTGCTKAEASGNLVQRFHFTIGC